MFLTNGRCVIGPLTVCRIAEDAALLTTASKGSVLAKTRSKRTVSPKTLGFSKEKNEVRVNAIATLRLFGHLLENLFQMPG